MNNYYAKVNLPDVATLLKDVNELVTFKNGLAYKIFDKSVLSETAIQFFNSINVIPSYIVVFDNPWAQNVATIETRYIHSDITLDEANNWKPYYCGINWELTPNTVSEFSWWDVSELKEAYPPNNPDKQLTHKILGGLHYHERNYKGVHEKAKCLDKTIISSPTLVRTDVAHAVTFNSPDQPRIGISIRFVESWNSWEECLEVFKPIIDK